MAEFKIRLDDKPHLSALMKDDAASFKTIVGTFVNLMEVAAEKNWHELPKAIHSSITFPDLLTGILNAVLTTKEINPEAYSTLGNDLHPLALLSDKRKDFLTGEESEYDWRSHFVLSSDEVSKETIEILLRKMLYLMRWFDIETVSKALMTSEFPVVDDKDISRLPFQPALMYQHTHIGGLHVGRFLHEVGAFDGGKTEGKETECPACRVGELKTVHDKYLVCPRCNIGFEIEEDES